MSTDKDARLPPRADRDSPSGKVWREWFERLGLLATVDVVNATAELVIAEREIYAASLAALREAKAKLEAPQPQPEAALCGEHCGHGLKFMKDGRCVAFIGVDRKGFDLMCGHRCTFPAPVEAPAVAETPHTLTALRLYKPPFRYEHGFIWDADSNMVADNEGQDVVLRVRGWGRISYEPDPEQLQDAVGELMAQALTEFWERRLKHG